MCRGNAKKRGSNRSGQSIKYSVYNVKKIKKFREKIKMILGSDGKNWTDRI